MKWIRHVVLFAAVVCASSSFSQEIASKMDAAIKKADSGIARILALTPGERNFDNVLGFLDRLTAEFDSETSMSIFQQYVNPDSKIRDQARQAEETVTNWYIEVGKREDLFNVIKAYADTMPNLLGEQKRMLEQTMRDYKRSGMSLSKEPGRQTHSAHRRSHRWRPGRLLLLPDARGSGWRGQPGFWPCIRAWRTGR